MSGPLVGLRVVELGGIGPGPHAAMMLADLGADVVRIERPNHGLGLPPGEQDWLLRGRRLVAADLKSPDGIATVIAMCEQADVFLEGFRPGVTERLGLGPDDLLARNPRLVYARMTGWGQDGPWPKVAGHDMNYIGLTGALYGIAPGRRPSGPADEPARRLRRRVHVPGPRHPCRPARARTSGRGQVVDAAIVDGVSVLAQMNWALRAGGVWGDRAVSNLLDGGAPFYSTYRCSDGGYLAVGSLEPQFYALLLEGLGLTDAGLPAQTDPEGWPVLRERFTQAFASRTRDEWAAVFAGTDACVSPILNWPEVAAHPHMAERGSVREIHGVVQAAPAPRFSRTIPDDPTPPPAEALTAKEALASWQD